MARFRVFKMLFRVLKLGPRYRAAFAGAVLRSYRIRRGPQVQHKCFRHCNASVFGIAWDRDRAASAGAVKFAVIPVTF